MKSFTSFLFICIAINLFSQEKYKDIHQLLNRGEYTKAYSAANAALANDSNNAILFYYKSESLFGIGEPLFGTKFLEKSIQLDSNCFEAHFRKAELLNTLFRESVNDSISSKLIRTALLHYKKANNIDPNDSITIQRIRDLEKLSSN